MLNDEALKGDEALNVQVELVINGAHLQLRGEASAIRCFINRSQVITGLRKGHDAALTHKK
jgi:hypothetical protein